MKTRNPRRPRGSTLLAAVTACALIPACGAPEAPSGKFPVYPAEGKVLFRGKPLAGALVSLHPVDEARFGDDVPRPTAETDAEGGFKLSTYGAGDGAPAGSYRVTVAGFSRPSSEGNVLAGGPVVKSDPLRGRYLDPKTSGLQAQIQKAPNVLPPFELK